MKQVKMMNDFEAYLESLFENRKDSKIKDAMMYSLLNKGKRIRPRLLFAVLAAYGQDRKKGFSAAAAIEMLHTYSLIHDDLPAMDDDTLRRGRPTCHVAFDEASAILAGDGLLTMAFEIAASAGEDAKTSLAIVSECAKSAGFEGMILGQAKDLAAESAPATSESQLEDIHLYKTGKLLTLPLVCGAILSNHHGDIDHWRTIGQLIGLSFQIQDDVLDVTATTVQLGKNAGSDKEQHKSTYVTLLGIEKAKCKAQELFQQAFDNLNRMNIHKEAITDILNELIHRNK